MSPTEDWVEVNHVPTRVLCWGKHITDDLSEVKELFLCISGNPGITTYYRTFLETIHKNTDVPVWILSHAGHELPPDTRNLPNIREHSCYYDLQGQTQHKIEFIKKFIPKATKIYLIGHSVGSKMISDILKCEENLCDRIQNCYLLFPTLEHIRDTPNGRFMAPLIGYFMYVIMFLSWIFTILPRKIRSYLIYITLFLQRQETADSNCIEASIDLVQPKVLHYVFFLALDEMENIKALDEETLNKFSKKFRIYFGASDEWCPVEFYRNLIEKCPSVDASLCTENIQHAFVLSSSKTMATKITKWYLEDRKKYT